MNGISPPAQAMLEMVKSSATAFADILMADGSVPDMREALIAAFVAGASLGAELSGKIMNARRPGGPLG